MTTASTDSASAMRPSGGGLRPSGTWAASAVALLIAAVALITLPPDAAAGYGTPEGTHVMTAGGRGGIYATARRDTTPARATALGAPTAAWPGHHPSPCGGDRRSASPLGAFAEFDHGAVLARSMGPLSQLEVAQSVMVLIEHRIAGSGSWCLDDTQCRARHAHRLRGPPSPVA